MNDAETGVENDTRLKRPRPVRQAPLRRPPLGLPASMGAPLSGTMNGAMSGALDAARDSGQALSSGLGAAVRQGLDSGQAVGGAVEAGVQGFVERGVSTAYQVIEEYMQRGQQAAQRLSPPGPGPARHGLAADAAQAAHAANAWAQNLAGPLGQNASSLAGPWMQLARAWVDGLSSLAPMAGQVVERMAGQVAGNAAGPAAAAVGDLSLMGVLQRFAGPGAVAPAAVAAGAPAVPPSSAHPAASAAPPAAPSARHAAGPRAKVTLEFMAGPPADVAVTLDPGADLEALQARWTGGADQGEAAAAPGSVVLYCAPGHVHVRLTLDQPPVVGRHLATLTDSQGQAWGSVSVVIAQAAANHPTTPAA